MMNYFLTVCRIRSCIGEHATLQFHILFVRGDQVAWL